MSRAAGSVAAVTAVREAVRVWRPGWPCDPYDVLRPLRRGAGDPSFARDPDGTLWRATQTPDGPATLMVRARPDAGEIELHAWGSGAGWALDAAPDLLGAADETAVGFRPANPRVAAAWRTNPHWRVSRSRRVLEAAVAATIEQKVTGKEAWHGWRLLLTRFGPAAPGPGEARGLHCLPGAHDLALIPSWEWLRCGIDAKRSKTVVRLARAASALERTVDLPPDRADAALQSILGVGVWTSAEVRQRAHGDADAVSIGDYHVATHVGHALLGAPLDDAGLVDLLDADRPHRYRVQHVVTTRLPGPPRHGPRMAPRRHLPA